MRNWFAGPIKQHGVQTVLWDKNPLRYGKLKKHFG